MESLGPEPGAAAAAAAQRGTPRDTAEVVQEEVRTNDPIEGMGVTHG